MQTHSHNHSQAFRWLRAFTITELLVAVSIMTFMVYGLYQMFHQTEKALRGNITQVDVLESGRAALEIMSRELEQLTASGVGGATNFYANVVPIYPPVLQLDLDQKTPLRTNLLQEFYFLSRQTNNWVGTGYRVIGADQGVGTLYRFSVSTNYRFFSSSGLSAAFVTAPMTNRATGLTSTNFHRVADGIIHLRLQAYDQDGRPLVWQPPALRTNFSRSYNVLWDRVRLAPTNNVALLRDMYNQTQVIFLSNALPACVELEMGVLEPATFIQYKSLKDTSAQVAQEFLRKRATKVHLFRQRIPIRTASP